MAVTDGVEADNAKRRILDAAAEAFMEQGFGVAIDDIADSVGATKGLIYYHFRSKFDIFLAAYEHGMRTVREQVEPMAQAPGSGRERLIAMSTQHVMNLMTNLAYHHVVHLGVREQSSTALKPRQRKALDALNVLRAEYEDLFLQVVKDGIADGTLRPVRANLAARTLLCSLNAVDMWFHRIEGQSSDELRQLADEIVDLVVGGLLLDPVR
ncbi:TetR/AcrR family transcriptional regulator [Streptomyces sp. NWU49]|uniref:TetR/AcrR family transcriptional regulator n=1 Tax=Streptomyces sp. NWU49 TaxID=2201153 RepID=UPI000D683D46|nr:TetR/AcrR family transcriptional regulator [Streptomyces sp. NWU49]PWJ08060.1 TetR/AcrR family transcriptional regulator [Streptomyces sp. NWU49]